MDYDYGDDPMNDLMEELGVDIGEVDDPDIDHFVNVEVHRVGEGVDIMEYLEDLEKREKRAKRAVSLSVMEQLYKDAKNIAKERKEKLEQAQLEVARFNPDPTFKNYYQILDIDRASGLNAINKAFKKLYEKWDPKKHDESEESVQKFKDINEAYTVLSDPKEKAKYDMLIVNMPSDAKSLKGDHVGIYLREQWEQVENSIANAQKRAHIKYLQKFFDVEDLPEIRKAKPVGIVGRKGKIYDKPTIMKPDAFMNFLKANVQKISVVSDDQPKRRRRLLGKKKKKAEAEAKKDKTKSPTKSAKDWADMVEEEVAKPSSPSPLKEFDINDRKWKTIKNRRFMNGVPLDVVEEMLAELDGRPRVSKKSPPRKPGKFAKQVRLAPKNGKKVGALVPVDPQTGMLVPPLGPAMTVSQVKRGMEKKAMEKFHKDYQKEMKRIEKKGAKGDKKKSMSPASGRNCDKPYTISEDGEFICSPKHRWVKISGATGKKLMKELEKMMAKSPTKMSLESLVKKVFNEDFSDKTEVNLKQVRKVVADKLGKEKLSQDEKDVVKRVVNQLVDEE